MRIDITEIPAAEVVALSWKMATLGFGTQRVFAGGGRVWLGL